MSLEQRLEGLMDLAPREVYRKLCEIKQHAAEEEIDRLAAKILKQEKAHEIKRQLFWVYSAVELLRIAAPYNPFTEDAIKSIFKQLIQKGPKTAEDKRAFETIACYRMVSLTENIKVINSLAELALLNLSQKWSMEMLLSIVEEKEEDLGREVKMKIAKRVAEGSSGLGVFIEKYPLLFMSSVNEIIYSSKKSQIDLIRKFNILNKEVITTDLIDKIINEKNNKKEFLQFVADSAVRQDMLKAVESLAEDRSVWIRCKVPIILLRKSKNTFYTSAAGASIRNSALEIWKRRMHDTSSQVRAGMLREVTDEVLKEIPEIKESITERLRDINADVRKEALKILAREYAEIVQKEAKSFYSEEGGRKCFMCKNRDYTRTGLVDSLLSIFITDHSVQVELVKAFFQALAQNKEEKKVLNHIILAEILCMVEKAPEDIEKLTGCSSALSIIRAESFRECNGFCKKHENIAGLLIRVLVHEEGTEKASPSKSSPPSLIIMVCEGYPKGSIPEELLDLLKEIVSSVTEEIFYRIARILTVTEYTTGKGWGKEENYSGNAKKYLEAKQIVSSDGCEFSLDMIKMEESHRISTGRMSVDIREQEERLGLYCKKMLTMLQMDLLECCIRSALLERVILKYFLSFPYSEHKYFENLLFFKQRLVLGIRSHPDTEIRLIFSVLSVLVCQQTSLALSSRSVISVLSLLCWVSIEYTRVRTVEAATSLFRSNIPLAQEFFSFFINLKRFKTENELDQNELYVLSEEACAMLTRETSKLGINPAQFSNDMPSGLCEELKLRGGWATTLSLLDDDHFSANLLTVFKPKTK